MPAYKTVTAPDTSTQATFIAALIGVGVLCIALIVLVFVFYRRWRRGKLKQSKPPETLDSIKFEGLHPAGTREAHGSSESSTPVSEKPGLLDVDKTGLPDVDKPGSMIVGMHSKSQRDRLTKKLAELKNDDDVEIKGQPGYGAGIIEEEVSMLWFVCPCVCACVNAKAVCCWVGTCMCVCVCLVSVSPRVCVCECKKVCFWVVFMYVCVHMHLCTLVCVCLCVHVCACEYFCCSVAYVCVRVYFCV
jgi:hypothetical protein